MYHMYFLNNEKNIFFFFYISIAPTFIPFFPKWLLGLARSIKKKPNYN